jgi:hypothetical protein
MDFKDKIYYSALAWTSLYILSLAEIIALSGTLFTCYRLSFEIIVVIAVHFLLTKNIRRDKQIIIFNPLNMFLQINRKFYFIFRTICLGNLWKY